MPSLPDPIDAHAGQAGLRITLVRSPIGNTERHKATVRGLGLRRIRHTVIQPDNLAIRGMIAKVAHLVVVEPSPLPDDHVTAAERRRAVTARRSATAGEPNETA